MSLIRLEKVSYAYVRNGHMALQEVSAEIPAGSITALLGPNGSGKTTLLRLILGILKPAAGQIWLAGRPLATYSRREAGRWLSWVPQDEIIPFDFTVLEYVLLGRAPYLNPLQMPTPEDIEEAQRALHQAGIAHLAKRTLPHLSGGERQLVLIARALAQHPRILLLDEPTAHLDLSRRGQILRLLRTLQAQGVTIILTTHDATLAADGAERVIILRQGRVEHAGPAQTILTDTILSQTYGVPVRVLEINGRRVILPDPVV